MENKKLTRFCGMLGFCMRAGKVIIGCEQVIKSLQNRGKGEVKLVIVSCDASDGTFKKVSFKCEFYHKKLIKAELDSAELGRLLGKLYAPAVIAITDDGFAKEILLAHEKTGGADDQNEKRKEVSS